MQVRLGREGSGGYEVNEAWRGIWKNGGRVRTYFTNWQRRYREHMIRGEDDLRRHEDTIHHNPLKHGLVQQVADWRWSSFQRYVRMGHYEADWEGALEQEVKEMRCGE
jgi:hypothetical protein